MSTSDSSLYSDHHQDKDSVLDTTDESSLHSNKPCKEEWEIEDYGPSQGQRHIYRGAYTVPAIISIPSVTTHPSHGGDAGTKGPRHGSSSEEFESEDEDQHFENLGDSGIVAPEVLLKRKRKRARVLARHSISQECVQERIRCVALSRIVYGDNHWQLAKAYAKLAQAYLSSRGLALQALGHAENARNVLVAADAMRSQGRQHYDRQDVIPVIELTYFTMGQAYMMLRHYQKAEQNLKKAELVLNERQDLPRGFRHPERSIKILTSLGKVAMKLGRAGYALDCLEKALELAQEEYGERSTLLIPIYQNLGHAEQKQGSGEASNKRALEMYLHAHGIAKENYKEDCVELADSAVAVSAAYSLLEEDEEKAKDYLQTAIDMYSSCEGRYSTKTIRTQDELCHLYIRQNCLEDAIKLLKTIIESKSVAYGDPSEEMANSHQLLGSIYLKMGKTELAYKQLNKCKTMLVCVLGSNHRKTKKIQETVEMIKRAPSSKKFHSSEDKLKERPRFTQVVGRSKPMGSTTTSAWD